VPSLLGEDASELYAKNQYNLRARYDWTFNEYKAFGQVGMTHVDDMSNQPSSFASGDGVLIPTTTWLRYTMPSYNTFDASLGLTKGAWDVLVFGQNLANKNASTFTTSGQDIKAEVERICGGKPAKPKLGHRPVAVVKWVDGTVLDTIWQLT